MKYVLVTGGVLSGIGKGVITSSLGLLLRAYGFRVTAIKIDPYLNIDAGTMSPFEHGEVFVMADGGECDLDLGNYERFMDLSLNGDNNITTGKIYQQVIERERRGDYLGKTVQVVPHVTDAIQDWVERVAMQKIHGTDRSADVCVIELGGTVGDIESMPFIEAMRQGQFRWGRDNFCLVHVSLVPVVGAVGEQKTKPTQHGIRELRGLGLSPDVLVCRSSIELERDVCEKLSKFCHVDPKHVIGVCDVSNLFWVPLLLKSQSFAKIIFSRLNLRLPTTPMGPLLDTWKDLAKRVDLLTEPICIALVGKYTGLSDSYHSVLKALTHSSISVNRKLNVNWVDASQLEENAKLEDKRGYDEAWSKLREADGILVPGGFGVRGFEGKVLAAKYARENNVPYLGVCLGMQTAVIDFARHVLHLKGASSTEIDDDLPHPVVIFMPEISKTHMGGTMRLGERKTLIRDGSRFAATMYGPGATEAVERHRHRYEVNPEYVRRLEAAGLQFVGQDETQRRMEIFELDEHPFFFGTQYHPEYTSRPLRPSPPFLALVLAAIGQLDRLDEMTRQLSQNTIPVPLTPIATERREPVDM